MKIRSLRWLPLLALTLTVSATSTTFAAGGKGAAKAGKGDKTAQLLDQLNLTDAQKEQLKPVLLDNAKAKRALKADTTLTADQKKEKTKENRAELQKQLEKILTPEQLDKLKELRKEQKAGAAKTDAAKDAPAAAAPAPAPAN